MGWRHASGSETCNNSATLRECLGVWCQTVSMAGTAANPVSHFGKQLKKERLAHGWSLPELSRRTGIDAGHLSRLENGKRPPTEARFIRLRQLHESAAPWIIAELAVYGTPASSPR